jgi:SAM-dependent methyltransferase
MQKELTEKYFKNHQEPFYYGDYLKIFNTDKNEKSVLDVGCGLAWLAKYFVNYTGLEYSKEVVVLATNKNRNVVFGDAEKTFPFPNNHFSMIIMMDILEHLSDPLNAVQESFRTLRSGGKIFAFVPDAQKWAWDDYSHKRPFSKKSLSKIFIDNGFLIKKISYEPVMRGVNKICKIIKINKRPRIFWLLAKLPFFRRNVYIIAEKV